MIELVKFDLTVLLRLNELRAGQPGPELEALEHDFERMHGTGSRLAVYGTLAPGRSNHDQVQALGGRWQSGYSVRGVLLEAGWGAQQGYPALRWSMAGGEVSVELLVSELLPQHWDRLDAFEGPGYRRILVPLLHGGRVVEIANLYESTADLEEAR